MTSSREEPAETPAENPAGPGPEDGVGIDDAQLPDDLVPGEDNPLAGGLEDGETVDGLLEEGKGAAESEEDPPSDTSQPG